MQIRWRFRIIWHFVSKCWNCYLLCFRINTIPSILSEILKLGHCLTLQWSLWQEVFGISLVGGLLQNCHSIGCKIQVKLKLMQRFKLKYKTVQCCILKLSLLWMWGSISAWIFYSNIKIKMIRSLIECEIHLTHPKGCNSRKCTILPFVWLISHFSLSFIITVVDLTIH